MLQRETTYGPPGSLSKLSEIEAALGEAIRGKPEVVRLSLTCLLARGHLLIEDVPGVERKFLIPFARKSKHRVRADDDFSVDGLGEMNPDKRKFWVRNGINQMIDQSRS